MDFLKSCFWSNKARNPFANECFNVAVHIRRENAHDNGCAGNRATTPNSYYAGVMQEIRETHSTKPLLFHVYSQGDQENFRELGASDVFFHLDEEIIDTFYGLVAADILVMSPSSFSYSAALLSDGIVYYKPFWHNRKSGWIIPSVYRLNQKNRS
jgi:hypothetical protein